MNKVLFTCEKDGIEFRLSQGITKGKHYELQEAGSDTYTQEVNAILLEQGTDFANSIFEHLRQCDGKISADNSTYVIAA